MDNNQFRTYLKEDTKKIVADALKEDSNERKKGGGGYKHNKGKKRGNNDDEDGDDDDDGRENEGTNESNETNDKKVKKKYRKGKEIVEKEVSTYRDRASERRSGQSSEYDVTDELALQFQANSSSGIGVGDFDYGAEGGGDSLAKIEMSKFLGGDVEHTHLVKGLDFKLASMVRSENGLSETSGSGDTDVKVKKSDKIDVNDDDLENAFKNANKAHTSSTNNNKQMNLTDILKAVKIPMHSAPVHLQQSSSSASSQSQSTGEKVKLTTTNDLQTSNPTLSPLSLSVATFLINNLPKSKPDNLTSSPASSQAKIINKSSKLQFQQTQAALKPKRKPTLSSQNLKLSSYLFTVGAPSSLDDVQDTFAMKSVPSVSISKSSSVILKNASSTQGKSLAKKPYSYNGWVPPKLETLAKSSYSHKSEGFDSAEEMIDFDEKLLEKMKLVLTGLQYDEHKKKKKSKIKNSNESEGSVVVKKSAMKVSKYKVVNTNTNTFADNDDEEIHIKIPAKNATRGLSNGIDLNTDSDDDDDVVNKFTNNNAGDDDDDIFSGLDKYTNEETSSGNLANNYAVDEFESEEVGIGNSIFSNLKSSDLVKSRTKKISSKPVFSANNNNDEEDGGDDGDVDEEDEYANRNTKQPKEKGLTRKQKRELKQSSLDASKPIERDILGVGQTDYNTSKPSSKVRKVQGDSTFGDTDVNYGDMADADVDWDMSGRDREWDDIEAEEKVREEGIAKKEAKRKGKGGGKKGGKGDAAGDGEDGDEDEDEERSWKNNKKKVAEEVINNAKKGKSEGWAGENDF